LAAAAGTLRAMLLPNMPTFDHLRRPGSISGFQKP
jgi:hypothetical protein